MAFNAHLNKTSPRGEVRRRCNPERDHAVTGGTRPRTSRNAVIPARILSELNSDQSSPGNLTRGPRGPKEQDGIEVKKQFRFIEATPARERERERKRVPPPGTRSLDFNDTQTSLLDVDFRPATTPSTRRICLFIVRVMGWLNPPSSNKAKKRIGSRLTALEG